MNNKALEAAARAIKDTEDETCSLTRATHIITAYEVAKGDGWMPIEMAAQIINKQILLYGSFPKSNEKETIIGYWEESHTHGWTNGHCDFYATHYRELPQPPTAE